MSPLVLLLFVSLKTSDNPEKIISNRYTQRQKDFISSVNAFSNSLKSKDKKVIFGAYKKLRKSFKQWEYLAEFKNPSLFREKINGAPLKKMEENSFGAIIIEPTGLQVIDEYMAEPNSNSFFTDINKLNDDLLSALKQIPDNPICYDHEIFEAGRIELIRLYTLGLTGFDSPGTLQSLEDAKTVIDVLKQDFTLFIQNQNVSKTTTNQLLTAFNSAEQIFKSQKEFDKFDRIGFLREVINPLYSGLLDMQKSLEIPMPKEIRNTPAALNYQAKLLFSGDFLTPEYYSGIPNQFKTAETRQLGMLLFFDPILSDNNQRACASCHKPELAFTDGIPKSIATGFQGSVNRNAPSLINCIYSERFFHDLRAEALEDQLSHVIADAKEFNTTQHSIIDKLNSSSEYKRLFSSAFGGYGKNAINPQTISFAISAYVGSLNSFNSAFDQYARGETDFINEDVKKGFNLFMGKAACGTCHFAPLFSGTVPPDYTESESEVLGTPLQWPVKKPEADLDPGRAGARLKEDVEIYRYSFKTPSIRNIAMTAPYMHNGGMKTLEVVMDFYNKGGGNGIGLNFKHQTLSSDKLNLSKREISQIIAFMKSLTDYQRLLDKPKSLPKFTDSALNSRTIGGDY